MRRLWIERHKAAAASLMKIKVYIEDSENGDTLINNVLCRKLGEVKNGQQKHFAISEESARVFVVGDKLSRNLYNEFIRIPEGREDVFLSGRNYLRPFSGNPFRFDGAVDQEVLYNRKKVNRKGAVILIAAVIVGILAGSAFGMVAASGILSGVPEAASPRTFEAQGMQITLTDAFSEVEVSGYTAGYATEDTAVLLLREDFALMEGFGELSLEAYGAMVLANNGFDQSVTLSSEDGLVTFDYTFTAPDSGTAFRYYVVLLKGPDAFWMVQFSAPAEDAEDMQPLFRQWAKTAVFSD